MFRRVRGEVDPRLTVELLHPLAATAARISFTYSRPWLRDLLTHLIEPRFAPALRNVTPPPEYALVWRATLSASPRTGPGQRGTGTTVRSAKRISIIPNGRWCYGPHMDGLIQREAAIRSW